MMGAVDFEGAVRQWRRRLERRVDELIESRSWSELLDLVGADERSELVRDMLVLSLERHRR
jgi:hypothetical protein